MDDEEFPSSPSSPPISEDEEPVRPHLYQEKGCWRRGTTKLLIQECLTMGLQWFEENNRWYAYVNADPMKKITTTIEIAGTILHRTGTSTNLELSVWDCSETIQVLYDWASYKCDRGARKCLDRYCGITEEIEKKILREMRKSGGVIDPKHELWWKSSNHGTFGKEIEEGDYVNVFGFLWPDFERTQSPSMWIPKTREDIIMIAAHVDVITGAVYEKKNEEILKTSSNR